MNRFIGWMLFQTFLLAMIVLGWGEGWGYGIEGARNLALGFVWLSLLPALSWLSPPTQDALRRRGKRTVPNAVEWGSGLLLCALFLWFGCWLTAFACVVKASLIVAGYEKALGAEHG